MTVFLIILVILVKKVILATRTATQYNDRASNSGLGKIMDFKIIRSLAEMETLAVEWNALLEESASHVPFLRFEYQRIWWQTLGGGEWKDADLVVTAAYQDERLVGIAPLFSTLNRDGEAALMLIGSIEISDYLDVIARPEELGEFVDGLLPALDAQLPDWKVLDWYNILDSSPTLPALEQSAGRRGWQYLAENYQHSPYIPLPGDWEAYLAGIDKKQRHEIRRKLRRAEEGPQPIRWYIASDKASLDQDIEALFVLMKQAPEKEEFLTPAMQEQIRATIHCAFEDDCLQLAFLEVGGEKAAAYVNFDYLNRIWVYNSGIDGRFREVSPGWVLLAYLLQWANENKREVFDFLRGDEDYKYRFGAIDRSVMRVQVRR